MELQYFKPLLIETLFLYYSSDVVLTFIEPVSNTHPLKLDQTDDPGYSSNPREAMNNMDMDLSRSQKQTPTTSQAHGACLTLNDHDRVRQFIQEFTFRGLLPHIEKNIRQLNDQVFCISRMHTPYVYCVKHVLIKCMKYISID